MTSAEHRSRLVALASQRGGTWFPELGTGPVEAAVVREHQRVGATVSIVELNGARKSRLVAAKTTWPRGDGVSVSPTALPPRPRVVAALDRGHLPEMQYRGLQITHDHFSTLGDPRFGAVRPIDLLLELRTVVMEHIARPTLRSKLYRPVIGQPVRRATLLAQLANAGGWLREYHGIDTGLRLPLRSHDRAEFVAAATAFVEFLSDRTGAPFLRTLERRIHPVAALLPQQLGLGLAHGDYAPRNLFVGPGARVTGFDALPRVRGAVLEDIARFTVAVRTGGFRMLPGLGEGWASRCEESFLAGYFAGDAPPVHQIRAFELLVLLNRWSSVVTWASPRSLRRRVRMRVREEVFGRRLRNEVVRVLRLLDDAAEA